MSRKKIAAIKRSGVRKGSGARTNILHKVAMEAAEEVMPESHRPSSPEEKSVKKTVTLPEIPFS